MSKPGAPNRFPAWLLSLGWLAFGVLGVATILVIARWCLMNSGHQAAERIIGAQRKKPAFQLPAVRVTAAVPTSKTQGMPLSSVPYFGGVLAGDEKSWWEFAIVLDEIRKSSWYRITPLVKVDGALSFTAFLPSFGINVPETMTEAEAAAEFLKQVDHRYSSLLAKWREAVAKGPWEKARDYKTGPNIWRFGSMSYSISQLLMLTAQARLQSGDKEGAWADWQTMKNSNARCAELYPVGSCYDQGMNYQMFGLAQSGMRSGAWTDDQLAELSSEVARGNILASARQDLEREKKSITDYYMNFHEHEEQFSKDVLKTPSQFDQFANQVKLKLITEQQIRDNMEVKLAEVDQRLSRFDPLTGFYVRPTEEELAEAGEGTEPPGMFGSFYFMIKDLNGGGGDDQSTVRYVIGQQSAYDQFRLAAALETYQRETGKYPDRLDAIRDKFPNGVPLDIAIGQPYLYQPDGNGGYKLWGTGIDGKSEGGNEKTDVTWTHRPAK